MISPCSAPFYHAIENKTEITECVLHKREDEKDTNLGAKTLANEPETKESIKDKTQLTKRHQPSAVEDLKEIGWKVAQNEANASKNKKEKQSNIQKSNENPYSALADLIEDY